MANYCPVLYCQHFHYFGFYDVNHNFPSAGMQKLFV